MREITDHAKKEIIAGGGEVGGLLYLPCSANSLDGHCLLVFLATVQESSAAGVSVETGVRLPEKGA